MGQHYFPLPSTGGDNAADRWTLLGFVRLTAGGTWDKVAFLAAHGGGRNVDDLRLDIDVVGAGASGFGGVSGIAGGGAPGGVRRIQMIHPDAIADLVPVTIGAGGAMTPRGVYLSNPGGDSRFGPYRAQGGRGGNTSTHNSITAGNLPASDISLSPGAEGAPSGTPRGDAAPSFGPGGGGSGAGGVNNGSSGGESGFGDVNSAQAGGAGGILTPATPPGNGVSPAGPFGFGSGGGGGYNLNTPAGLGGTGGTPGGGGGGGGAGASGNIGLPQSGGPGGQGGVTIRLFGRAS